MGFESWVVFIVGVVYAVAVAVGVELLTGPAPKGPGPGGAVSG